MNQSNIRQLAVVVALLALGILSSTLAEAARLHRMTERSDIQRVAIYPGTFSPYHLGHEHITENLLKSEGFDAVIVVPNFYTFHKPFALGWNKRLEFLEARYFDHPDVYLSLDLKLKPPEVVRYLRKQLSKDLHITLIAGADVLESSGAQKWIENFLLGTANEIMIVSSSQMEPLESYQRLFDVPVRLTSWTSSPIRGSAVRARIKSHGLDNWVRERVHPRVVSRIISLDAYDVSKFSAPNHKQELLRAKLDLQFRQRVIPYLDQKLHLGYGTKINWTDELIADITWLNIEDYTNLTSAIQGAYLALSDHDKISYSDFHQLFTSTPVMDYYKSSETELREIRPVQYQAIHNNKAKGGMTWIHKLAATLSTLKHQIVNFDGVRLDQSQPVASAHPEKEIILYRGLRIPAGMTADQLIDQLKQHGDLSQTAREHFEGGATIESALAISNHLFETEGEKEIIVNHVVGNWRKSSSLVSATTDFDLARSFAGEGGIVLTLATTPSRVLFTNEMRFWKGTPWDQTGNPRFLQAEVAFKNSIKPSEILDIQKVDNLIVPKSNYQLRGWQLNTSLKALVWTNYLRLTQSLTSKEVRKCQVVFRQSVIRRLKD